MEAAEIAGSSASPPMMQVILARQRRRVLAVDKGEGGHELQAFEGALHGEEVGLADIVLVDLLDAGPADGPGERALADQRGECVALLFRELLGVVETSDGTGGVEHHRSCAYRAGERTAAGFIYAADDLDDGGREQIHGGR
jgi:hypothetical protein